MILSFGDLTFSGNFYSLRVHRLYSLIKAASKRNGSLYEYISLNQ